MVWLLHGHSIEKKILPYHCHRAQMPSSLRDLVEARPRVSYYADVLLISRPDRATKEEEESEKVDGISVARSTTDMMRSALYHMRS